MAVKGTPALLRTLNQGALMQHLRQHGPLSRAQLARDTGLSKPTVSQALADLEDAGLVRPVGPAAPSRGRTAMLYEPDPTAGYGLGAEPAPGLGARVRHRRTLDPDGRCRPRGRDHGAPRHAEPRAHRGRRRPH